MENELSVKDKQFEVFFYNDFKPADFLSDGEVKKLLEVLTAALNSFCKKQFKISKHECMLNINLVAEDHIRAINKEYRKKDKVTDVLSFPLQENLRGGKYDNFLEELEFGDLFICHAICKKQAEEFSITYAEEFLHLIVHGFLHLCGYDHEISADEEKLMEKFEEEILLEIKKARS